MVVFGLGKTFYLSKFRIFLFQFPHSDDAWKKVELEGFDVLIQYLNGSKKINYGKPPSFSEKFDKNKSKNRKSENVRKRDLLLTLMREKRPDKILKLIQVNMYVSFPTDFKLQRTNW